MLIRADAHLLAAVAAIFGREHELLLKAVIIAFGPAVIGALTQLEKLFGGKIGALLRRVELGPVFRELIASVLGRVDAIPCNSKALGVADARREALSGRKFLVALLGVSSSLQGERPGDSGMRFSAWQESVAEAELR
ncbi:hypothetical protein SS37A_28090 [Methylocystis iwaonis]|uniref:Uncharacterized protein n=1 Tax=Methylocystis iwaonis TaxID=2885079 RepID=A0ABN6VHW5_9HYPH|nr:hypothetical protein SS37A_28090 [Methylocystis iwaonis]